MILSAGKDLTHRQDSLIGQLMKGYRTKADLHWNKSMEDG